MNPIIFRGTSGQKDDGNDTEGGVLTQSPAKVQAVASRHHDIEQKERGGLTFGVGKYLIDGQIGANGKAGAFQMVLHQAGDINIIF
jgi:hypothetical protein